MLTTRCLLFLTLTTQQVFGRFYFSDCPSDVITNDVGGGCRTCVKYGYVRRKRDPISNHLNEYWRRNKVECDVTEKNEFSWKVDNSVYDVDNITMTLYLWNETTGLGKPLPGCCDVTLGSRKCFTPSCVEGTIIPSLTMSNTSSLWVTFDTDHKCYQRREPNRFFHSCSPGDADFLYKLGGYCLRYDSYMGGVTAHNTTDITEFLIRPREPHIGSYEPEIKTCKFQLNQNEVTSSEQKNHDVTMDDLFGRRIHQLLGFHWSRGEMIDRWNTSRKCDDVTMTSIDVLEFYTRSYGDKYICISLWPNGTDEFLPMGTHVICTKQLPGASFPTHLTLSLTIVGLIVFVTMTIIVTITNRRWKIKNKLNKTLGYSDKEMTSLTGNVIQSDDGENDMM
ncbi:uncharacterized protein LOC100177831 [Ciona intestinalis]